jgi:hypothetical protein
MGAAIHGVGSRGAESNFRLERPGFAGRSSWPLDGLTRRACDVLPKPIDEVASAYAAGGEVQHELLLLIHRSGDVGAVKEEERRHPRVGDALVAVHERMPLRKGEAQRTGLLNQSGMKVASAERCSGLRNRRFENAQIPDARSATARRKHEAVQFNHLA